MKLDVTYILARVIGPMIVMAGVLLVGQPARMRAMLGEFLASDALMAFGGFINMGLALILLALHNRWSGLTAGIVTFFGWLMLARGAALLLAPGIVRDAGVFVMDQPALMPIAGCLFAFVGIWLSYTGYIAAPLRVETSSR